MSKKYLVTFSFFMYRILVMYRILELLDIATIRFGLFNICPIASFRVSSFFQLRFPKEANQKGIGAKNHIVEKRHA